jgi:hypothetical protein
MPGMTSGRSLDVAVIELLERQFGLATRAQLRAAGMTPAHLRRCLNAGWQVVLPGVVAAFTGRLDPRQRLTAAMLFSGPGAMITSSTAARWRGAENAHEDGRVHLCVPAHRSVSVPAQLVIRRTTRPDADAWRRGPLTIASPGRSFGDAARDATGVRAASAVVIEAVQRRLVTLDALRNELEDGPRCGSAQLRAAIDAAATGAWSMPEHEVLHLLRQSGLFPVVWGNPILTAADGTTLPPPDAWLDDIALAIQIHSRRYHFAEEDWEGTILRDGVFTEYGVPVVAFTPRRIRDDPRGVLDRVRRIHTARLDLPRPDIFARPREITL